MTRVTMLVLFAIAAPAAVKAEVVDSAAGGFTVRSTAVIAAPAAKVYDAIRDVGRWWDPAHTFSGDAKNLTIDATAGGCFCEQLAGGGSVHHMTVVFAQPGAVLRLSGGIGPLQALAVSATMTWTLTEKSGLTTVEMIYTVGGYAPGGLATLAPIVDGVLASQLQRLAGLFPPAAPMK